MRRIKELILVLVILAAMVALIGYAHGKDLRDFLLQPPASVYQEYDYSEDTFRLYNMVATKELGQSHEARIKALENNMGKLRIEVNELKKQVSEAATLSTLDEREVIDTNIPPKPTGANEMAELKPKLVDPNEPTLESRLK